MKKITLLFALLLFSYVGFSQSIIVGTGTDASIIASGQPIDSYNQSFKFQMLITAAELSASLNPNDELTALGFSIASDNGVGDLLGYTIKLGHTTSTELASAHDASPTIVVKDPFNYDPIVTSAGEFDMIPFDTNFEWNGVDNVLVEICKDINTNAGGYPFGQVRVTNTSVPSTRYFRANGVTTCGEDTDTSIGIARPNIQFNYTVVTATCEIPNTLNTGEITSTTTELSWVSGGSGETNWEVAVQAPGTGIPTGNGTSTAGTNPYTAESLTAETDYEFYVRADCGGSVFSDWAGPFDFATVASPLSFVIGTSTDVTPTAFAQPIDSYNQSFKYQMLISVTELSATLAPNDELTALGFSIASDNAIGDLLGYTIKMGHTTSTELATAHDNSPTIVVKYPFNYNPVVTDPGVFDMIAFDTNFAWNGSDNILIEICKEINTNAGGYPFGQVRVTLTTEPSNRYFRANDIAACAEETTTSVDVGRPNMQFNYINVASPCNLPNTLNADAITESTAELSWDLGGSGETNWWIQIQAPGDGYPSGSGISTEGANPYTADSLFADSDYEFYVRADCGEEVYSNWAGPFEFSTLCEALTVPYTHDFSTYLDGCWKEANDTDIVTGPNDEDGDWNEDGFLNDGTSGAARFNFHLEGDSDWIVSPPFDLTAGSFGLSVEVGATSFSGTDAVTMGSDDVTQLLISSDNGATWSILMEWNDMNTPSNTGDTHIIDLSEYTSARTKFAFLADEGTSITGDFNFYVDNFRVDLYSVLSINNLQLTEGFTFYPNPVENVLNVSAKNNIEKLQIVNMLGQVIKTARPNSTVYALDFSELNTGVYFVRATVNGVQGIFRIVKK